MGWSLFILVAVFVNISTAGIIPRGGPQIPAAGILPCGGPIQTAGVLPCGGPYNLPVAAAIAPAIQPTLVDGSIVQSLINTLQLFIVSDLLGDTLDKPNTVIATTKVPQTKIISKVPCKYVDYEYDIIEECDCECEMESECECEIESESDCVCESETSESRCVCYKRLPRKRARVSRVNYGLNKELILPPVSPELPCGLGYLPGALPVVAQAYAPCCNNCCGCGGDMCSAACFPVCSPCSCTALAAPLCPNMSPLVKSIIL